MGRNIRTPSAVASLNNVAAAGVSHQRGICMAIRCIDPALTPGQAKALGVIDRTLRYNVGVNVPVRELGGVAIANVAEALEATFCIPLDVDEVFDAVTVGGLLDLIEAKLHPGGTEARTPCAIYEFAAYRSALGLDPEPEPEPPAPRWSGGGPPFDPREPRRRGLPPHLTALAVAALLMMAAGALAGAMLAAPQ